MRKTRTSEPESQVHSEANQNKVGQNVSSPHSSFSFPKANNLQLFLTALCCYKHVIFPNQKVCSEIRYPKFSTQVIKGKIKKFSSSLSLRIPMFDSKTVNIGFMIDKRVTGIFICKYFGFSRQ